MGPDSDGRVESAMGQAKALQQLLVRTAYALHLCAENAATAHEQRAEQASESQRPSRVDHRLQAKRWQAVAAQAIDVVKRWDGRHEGGPPGAEAVDVDPAIDVAAANDRTVRLARIVDRLVNAGYELQIVAALAEPSLQQRTKTALDDIDVAVRDISAFAQQPGEPDEPADR